MSWWGWALAYLGAAKVAHTIIRCVEALER